MKKTDLDMYNPNTRFRKRDLQPKVTWLTVYEAAMHLGLSIDVIYRLISIGKIPANRYSERCIRIKAEVIDEIIEKGFNHDIYKELRAELLSELPTPDI